MLVLAATLPYPAGLVLAASATALLCSLYHAVQTGVRGDAVEWELVRGGLIVAVVLGAIGLLLVGVGAPAFE
ncbi:MAG TPA: hypothetical protein VJT75_04660 [Thermoleophilaceae bacterium]|nr:hypothetical protein [Thermoleophilaceae bacterium]